MKILLIEDELQLLNNIKESLEKEDFLIETAMDFNKGLHKALIYDYDCILLDVMLPNGSGIDVLKELKKNGKSGNVIIISAKDSLDDKLLGLELGADDYLIKPFHLAELNARVKAVIRRKNLKGNNSLEFLNVTLNIDERKFTVDQNEIHLNRKEFDLLYYFLLNKNRLITKSALAEFVWGDNSDDSDNFDFVYYQIKNLRKKLTESQAHITIEAVYGVGYKLTEQ
ncbi:response regulator transcription factor [Arenibacter sp. M-2]|uniref:response regulator transcription factor n=1 Tax=Arenibacter sp. M-2 TaxID=3053612 RepID=UPI002571045D|nr:response regulator transcription factor [Arenibacter sp. M-2]MDL5513923.1 response regulator transcription factor [Arenibacter sp. M-2]